MDTFNISAEIERAIKFDFKVLADLYIQRLPIGFREQVVDMAFETKRTLLAGCKRSAIILSAETLFRVNCELILQTVRTSPRTISYKVSRKNIVLDKATNGTELLDTLTFHHSINLLRQESLVDDQTWIDMHALKYLRNQVVHGTYPALVYYDPPSTITSEEEFAQMFTTELPPQQFLFSFKVDDRKINCVVDQDKREIFLDDLSLDWKLSVIAVSLMLSCIKEVVEKFSNGGSHELGNI